MNAQSEVRESSERLRRRLVALREARAFSIPAAAQQAGVQPDEVRLAEEDPDRACPVVIGLLADTYGVTVSQMLAEEEPVHDEPLLRERPGGATDELLAGFISAGLYLARAWRRVYSDLLSRDLLSGVESSDFACRDPAELRSLLAEADSDGATFATIVREYFDRKDSERFPVRAHAYHLGALVLTLRFPAEAQFDGCYQRDVDGVPVVLLNMRKRPPEHLEFVAAHEMLHFLRDDRESEFLHRGTAREGDEALCDQFADHLILPLGSLPRVAPRNVEGFLRGLHASFGASRGVLSRQLVRRGLFKSRREVERIVRRIRLYEPRTVDAAPVPTLPAGFDELLNRALQEGLVTPARISELRDLLRDDPSI